MHWRSLEMIRGLSAVPAIWRRHLGEHFEPFKRGFLLPRAEPAKHFPCAKCGCAHEIIMQADEVAGTSGVFHGVRAVGRRDPPHPNPLPGGEGDTDVRAVCTCEPWNCADLILSAADIQVLELNWPKLGRALGEVFGLDSKFSDLRIHQTCQIGSWGADAVPAILTIQSEPHSLRPVLCELIARLRKRFILIAPSHRHLDATCHELMANADAEFFALENLIVFDGPLRLMGKIPGELFARFSPQPKEAEQDVARRAFALIQALDSEIGMKPPTLLSVFRLYCIEELSADHIARIQHCSKATIISRLNQIRARTGVDPQDLRRISGHLRKVEEAFEDSRASHIHRERLIYDDDAGETGD
jgi:hypothetical protein